MTGGLSTTPLHVWRSHRAEQFIRLEDLRPVEGRFTIRLEAGSLYSLTNTTGQTKGTLASPPQKPFPLPYREDFEGTVPGGTPRYFSDQGGIFEVARRADGRGRALRLATPVKGIEWQKMPEPETILGELAWSGYEVGVEALIERSGFVALFGRVGILRQSADPPTGYRLKVADSGAWTLTESKWTTSAKKKTTYVTSVLASGKVPFGAGAWHAMKMRFKGAAIEAVIDGKLVGKAQDASHPAGMIGLGSGWHGVQFDNLAIRPLK